MKTGSFLVILASLIWGVGAPIRRSLLEEISPLTLVFLTSLSASIIVIILHHRVIHACVKSLKRKEWITIIIIVLFGSVVAPLSYNCALQNLNTSSVIVLEKIKPIFVIILGALFLGERHQVKFFVGAAFLILISGLFVIVSPNLQSINFEGKIFGILMTILTAFSFACAAIASKFMLKNVAPVALLGLRLVLGTLTISILYGFLGNHDEISIISGVLLFKIAALGFLTLYVAFFLFYCGLEKTTAGLASVLELVTPISGAIVAWMFLGEAMAVSEILLGISILGGSFYLSKLKKN